MTINFYVHLFSSMYTILGHNKTFKSNQIKFKLHSDKPNAITKLPHPVYAFFNRIGMHFQRAYFKQIKVLKMHYYGVNVCVNWTCRFIRCFEK
jgi:hypothetical protein